MAEPTDNRRQPRPTAERWLCRACKGMLGEVTGQTVSIRLSVRHGSQGRREITAQLPCSQICDRCGAVNVRGG